MGNKKCASLGSTAVVHQSGYCQLSRADKIQGRKPVELHESNCLSLDQCQGHIASLPATITQCRKPYRQSVSNEGSGPQPHLIGTRQLITRHLERFTIRLNEFHLTMMPVVLGERALEEVPYRLMDQLPQQSPHDLYQQHNASKKRLLSA